MNDPILENSSKKVTIVVISNRRASEIVAINSLHKISHNVIVVTNIVDDECADYKCKFIFTNSENFSYLRNLGAFFAETPYILEIDADEELSDNFGDEINSLEFESDLYCVETKMYVGEKELKSARVYRQRVYNKNKYFYVGKVHERLYGEKSTCKRIQALVLNHSYTNWNHVRERSRNVAFKGRKNAKLIVSLFYPLLGYLKNEGWSDGVDGLRWLCEGLIAAIFRVLYGVRGYSIIDPVKIKKTLPTEAIAQEEREYISYILNKISDLNNSREFWYGKKIKNELMEQISSPFLEKI